MLYFKQVWLTASHAFAALFSCKANSSSQKPNSSARWRAAANQVLVKALEASSECEEVDRKPRIPCRAVDWLERIWERRREITGLIWYPLFFANFCTCSRTSGVIRGSFLRAMETVAVETLASFAKDRIVGVGNRTILSLDARAFNG